MVGATYRFWDSLDPIDGPRHGLRPFRRLWHHVRRTGCTRRTPCKEDAVRRLRNLTASSYPCLVQSFGPVRLLTPTPPHQLENERMSSGPGLCRC